MRQYLLAGVLGTLVLAVVSVQAQPASPAPLSCEEQLAQAKLELAIADRATPLQAQAFQQADRQLRQEVAGEWAKANARAEREAQRATDALKHLASTTAAPAKAEPTKPAAPAP